MTYRRHSGQTLGMDIISTVRNGRDMVGECKHIFWWGGGQSVPRSRGRGTQVMATAPKPIQCEQSMEGRYMSSEDRKNRSVPDHKVP